MESPSPTNSNLPIYGLKYVSSAMTQSDQTTITSQLKDCSSSYWVSLLPHGPSPIDVPHGSWSNLLKI